MREQCAESYKKQYKAITKFAVKPLALAMGI